MARLERVRRNNQPAEEAEMPRRGRGSRLKQTPTDDDVAASPSLAPDPIAHFSAADLVMAVETRRCPVCAAHIFPVWNGFMCFACALRIPG
jgi:hypothetical protein